MPTKIKEIPLLGLSTSPSDYEAPDGNLSIAHGVHHQDASIINASESSPSVLLIGHDISDTSSFYHSEKVVYQHANSGYHNLIISFGTHQERSRTAYGYIKCPDRPTVFTGPDDESVDDPVLLGTFAAVYGQHVTNIISSGNILIFYTDNGPYHYRFHNDSYIFVGIDLPEIRIKPYIKTELRYFTDEENRTAFPFTGLSRESVLSVNRRAEHRREVTDAVFAKVNAMANAAAKDKKFVMPFLVRMAYRLYDGSITMHTSPLLMYMTEGALPILNMTDDFSNPLFNIRYIQAKLSYIIDDYDSFKEQLDQWSDIITGIIFSVSAPLYTYDSSKDIDSITFSDQDSLSTDHMLSAHSVSYRQDTDADALYFSFNFPVARRSADAFITTSPGYVINLPKPEQSLQERISKCGIFYIVSEVKIGNIGRFGDVPVDADLTNIYTLPTLTDDYQSHDEIIPSIVSSYNGRISMSGISYAPYSDCYPFSIIPYQSADDIPHVDGYKPTIDDNRQDRTPLGRYRIAIALSNSVGNKSTVVTLADSGRYSVPADNHIPYLFYPNPDARRLYIVTDNAVSVFSMEQHPNLNGAYFIDIAGSRQPDRQFSTSDDDLSAEEQDVINAIDSFDQPEPVQLYGEIRTSEVNNPFLFRASNVEQVGSGSIIAIVPISMPLTQDATGGADMIVFTDEGVWTLATSQTGTWSSKHCISRDVLLSPSSVLQLDMSIIFATARGLMQITGTTANNIQIVRISDIFDGPKDIFTQLYLDHISSVMQTHAGLSMPEAPSFQQYLDGANMHYDYPHQRIYIGNAAYPVCYVYSIRDQLWTTIPLHLTSAINSYPNALAMATDDSNPVLIDLSLDAQPSGPGSSLLIPDSSFILTRPIKLDEPDMLKTVRTVVARGNFDGNRYTRHLHATVPAVSPAGPSASPISIILYASRDLRQWYQIASSQGPRLVSRHGTPYRYFRVGLITRLQPGESLSRLTVEYELRLTNKVR